MIGFTHIMRRIIWVGLFVGGFLMWQFAYAPTARAATDGFDLELWPNVMQASQDFTLHHIISVRGKNGIDQNVTITVSGLPAGTVNVDSDSQPFYFCPSTCLAKPSSPPPWSVRVKDGEQLTLNPNFGTYGSPVPVGDYTLTVTVSASGYTTKSDTLLLKIRDQYAEDCEPFINLYPSGGQSLKITMNAGESLSGSLTYGHQPCYVAGSEGEHATPYASSGSFFTNFNGSGHPGLDQTMSLSLSPSSGSLSQDFMAEGTVNFTLTTSSSSPNGSYAIMPAVRHSDGTTYYPLSVIGIIVQNGTTGTAAPTSTPSATSTPTATTPVPVASSSATPTVTDTTSPEQSVLPTETAAAPSVESLPDESGAVATTQSQFRVAGNRFFLPVALATALTTLASFGGLVGAGVSLIGWVGSIGALIGIFAVSVLESLGLRRRRYPWGVVFDGETGLPLEFVIVRLWTEVGVLVETRVTDRSGRFGFLGKPGAYRIDVVKTGYRQAPASEIINPAYEPILTGTTVHIANDNHAVVANIGLLPKGKRHRFPFNSIATLARRVLQVTTLVIGVVYLAVDPSVITLVIVGATALMLAGEWLTLMPKNVGVVTDHRGQPVVGLPLRVIATANHKVVASMVTDQRGRYAFLVRPGVYQLKLLSHQYIGPDWLVHGKKFVISDSLGGQIARSFQVTEGA